MISFIDFMSGKAKKQEKKLLKRVTALFPTLVEHGYLTRNDIGIHIPTKIGNIALKTFMHSSLFDDDEPFEDQIRKLVYLEIIAFDEGRNENVVTLVGMTMFFMYVMYAGGDEEYIVGEMKRAEKICNDVIAGKYQI